MKALSIRQPWAWMILHAGKDIENRTWHTGLRGRILIHAAKGMTHDEYHEAMAFCALASAVRPLVLPCIKEMQRGGIVGSVEIVDCVNEPTSRWFMGTYGFVLRDPRPLPFVPFKGSLGFFDAPDHLIGGAA